VSVAVEDDFIGVGWGFPPVFENGAVRMTGGIANIRESLRIITGTALGERVMRPDFGCALDDEVFGAMNSNRLAWIENVVRRAILLHEPRIDAERIAVTPDAAGGRLNIEIDYRVRGVNSRFNMVFPFYLEQA
jgi:hypothetical protein